MNNILEDLDWEVLLSNIRDGHCTPFLGAGAAAGVLPLGAEVARKWAEEHNYPLTDVDNLPRVAQYLAVRAGTNFPKKTLAAALQKCALPDFKDPTEPHGLLADLPLPVYITTNYDGFMAAALRACEKCKKDPVQVIARWNIVTEKLPSAFDRDDYVPSPTQPVVFHLHGQQDYPDSMVLTEDDYLDFLIRFTDMTTVTSGAAKTAKQCLLPPPIEEALTNASLLFLGYGLTDPDFRVLFRALVQREYFRLNQHTHMSVQLPPVGDEKHRENMLQYLNKYYGQLSIRVFWGTCHEFVAELRRRWEAYNAKTG